jgi:hypothetical protein
MTIRVLIACERSGIFREAFRTLGADAWSCDTEPTEQPGQHRQADARQVILQNWDLVIAHPPCTYLTRANAHGRRRNPDLEAAAAEFATELWACPCPNMMLENPIGKLWQTLGTPAQIVRPSWFGEPSTKRLCLWLRGIPPLMATVIATNATDRVTPMSQSRGRSAARSKTSPAFAAAAATQWYRYLTT